MGWFKKLFGGSSQQVVCRHVSLMAAMLYGEKYPVRIVSGPTIENTHHSQAQAMIDGKWVWLEGRGEVWEGDLQFEFTGPPVYMTMEEYCKLIVINEKGVVWPDPPEHPPNPEPPFAELARPY